ncbi:YlbF family regulator [Indiicoccus explosivorum]|uniref:YlbF family regulator n=1 Tax=Indiicoccus explosivorum TaxID=1917864 RepID=UPI000B43E686|nr:YlbF family regulator [Indiicoccus explosivorum]
MTVNIYDDINKLEGTFRKTDEFKNLEQAVEDVTSDKEAADLFRTFRDLQLKLQEKQMKGEEISGEEMEYAQKVAQLAQQNGKILEMLEAEMALSRIIDEVNKAMTRPVQSLYDKM